MTTNTSVVGLICHAHDALVVININLQTKLEVPTFTRSKDMHGAQNIQELSSS